MEANTASRSNAPVIEDAQVVDEVKKVFTLEEVNEIVKKLLAQKDEQIQSLQNTHQEVWMFHRADWLMTICNNPTKFSAAMVSKAKNELESFLFPPVEKENVVKENNK